MDLVNKTAAEKSDAVARCSLYLKSLGIHDEQITAKWLRLAAAHDAPDEPDIAILIAALNQWQTRPDFAAVPPEAPLEMPPQPLGHLHLLFRLTFWRRIFRRFSFKRRVAPMPSLERK
jgi:hypothetical protein